MWREAHPHRAQALMTSGDSRRETQGSLTQRILASDMGCTYTKRPKDSLERNRTLYPKVA